MSAPLIERASPTDLMEFAADSGPAPMQVGGIVILQPDRAFDLTSALELLAARMSAIPRLRQRLARVPPGCGRPLWLDDAAFDVWQHLRVLRCPPPGDDRALLDLAATLVVERLPKSRPLWAATFVSGLTGNRTAMVVVFHHVLADGIGGLAVFANLVDDGPVAPTPAPRIRPPLRMLVAEAWSQRLRAATRVSAGWRSVRQATAELGIRRRPPRAVRCSLNRPTGPRRRLAVVEVDLVRLREAAHRQGGTINDAVLSAIAGALHAVLERRGESVNEVVISVPVSRRAATDVGRLGNEVGVMRVAVPATGEPVPRLREVAAATRRRKAGHPGSSSSLLDPAFRLMAALHVLRWLVDHQRLVHTFVTNVPGPPARHTFNGSPVTAIIAINGTSGNVTVAFGALSYAGSLAITVLADPDRTPDLDSLADALQAELDSLVRTADPPRSMTGLKGSTGLQGRRA